MNNTLKLLCLVIVPSLSFAADQTASVDFSGYSLTVKILEAYFKANKSTVSSFSNTIYTKPDSATITVFEPNPEDATVEFLFNSSGIYKNAFAPGIRKDILSLAIAQTLEGKLTWQERFTGYSTQEYALDNGITCKYNIWSPPYVSCHGSIPRELFDAMKKNTEKIEAMKQEANQA
jgi:hypothetical protein